MENKKYNINPDGNDLDVQVTGHNRNISSMEITSANRTGAEFNITNNLPKLNQFRKEEKAKANHEILNNSSDMGEMGAQSQSMINDNEFDINRPKM